MAKKTSKAAVKPPDKQLSTTDTKVIGPTDRAALKRTSGWSVLYEEHAWKHTDDDAEGFIDLVLEHDAQQVVLLIECKRLQNKEWILLPPKWGPKGKASRARVPS